MVRYAAFLRGVSPMNAKMPELKRCFESAGFEDVKTILSSGNVVFSTRKTPERSLEQKVEAAMEKELDRTFMTIVRPVDTLRGILEANPYRRFRSAPAAKRVITFLRSKPKAKLDLPIEADGARILAIEGMEVFTTYVPGPKAAAFMTLLEKTFGKDITTRTWETVQKVAR